MNQKLYVENLPPTATEESLKKLFSEQGAVAQVELMMDPSTGISRGRAFVTMATPEGAQAAQRTFHSFSLGGRNIAVSEARPQPENPAGLIGHGFELGRSKNDDGQRQRHHNRSRRSQGRRR